MADTPPTAVDDTNNVAENATIAGASVLANDSDPDGPPLQVEQVNGSAGSVGSQITLPSGALLTMRADGTYDYDPNHAFDYLPEAGSGASNTPGADSFTYTLVGGGTATVTITITGVDTDDTLTGTAGDDALDGGVGNDTLQGGLGNDTLDGGEGNDSLAGGGGTDVLNGGEGNDTLFNSDGSRAGGPGDDYYFGASGALVELAGEGVDTVEVQGSYTLPANFENLIFRGTGIGNELVNRIEGGSRRDTLDGRQGADVMIGGTGSDTYYVDDPGDRIVEFDSSDFETVFSSASTYTLDANVERLILAGSASINGAGSAGANTLDGNSGANLLNGRGGADLMRGWLGNDTYIVDDVGDQVVESSASGGIDTVQSSLSYTLRENVERLYLTGTAAIDGQGNELANTINGNAAANVLDGGSGADIMKGGLGDDTYIVDNVGDRAAESSAAGGNDLVLSSVSFTLGGNVERLTLTGSANINGNGNTLDNEIVGNAGNNLLNGLAGGDTMRGGLGDDLYIVDNAGDLIVELAGQGADRVQASVTYSLLSNIEELILTGAGNINGAGNALANLLVGNSGNNLLNGKGGADTMKGGNGDDVYIVDNAGDVAQESSATGGTDRVQSAVSFTIGAFIENLALTGAGNVDGTGNASANVIDGNTGANVLFGLDGDDYLRGGAGADSLHGGLGADKLNGSTGADGFFFDTALGEIDRVEDYAVADDTILLENGIFTGLAAGTLSAAAFHIGSAAADADDRIIYNNATGALLFDVDGNGNATAVQFATLATGLAMTASEFTVI